MEVLANSVVKIGEVDPSASWLELDHHKKVVEVITQVSERVNASLDLGEVCDYTFELMEEYFGFRHAMIFLANNEAQELSLIQSYGYEAPGIGAKVPFGKGVFGMVARRKKLMRMGNVNQHFLYLSTIKNKMNITTEEVDLPGLSGVVSQLAIPLIIRGELLGVFAVESMQVYSFDQREEDLLNKVATQLAIALNNARQVEAMNKAFALKLEKENLEKMVEERTREIEAQNALIQQKSQQITDSIQYAELIQRAILPPEKMLDKRFRDHFIYFQPKDIVSGDFYWAHEIDNLLYVAVADCTGHGVPGAMMSMIGYTGLRSTIVEQGLREPHDILEGLSKFVEKALFYSDLKDGMDIVLLCLDKKRGTLTYSGANTPLFVLRENTIMEFRGCRRPVGRFNSIKYPFTQTELVLDEGDLIYLFSDGFVDQFGGKHDKRFKKKAFKNLLLEVSAQPLNEQRSTIKSVFEEWKGSGFQVDDVTVIGLRI